MFDSIVFLNLKETITELSSLYNLLHTNSDLLLKQVEGKFIFQYPVKSNDSKLSDEKQFLSVLKHFFIKKDILIDNVFFKKSTENIKTLVIVISEYGEYRKLQYEEYKAYIFLHNEIYKTAVKAGLYNNI